MLHVQQIVAHMLIQLYVKAVMSIMFLKVQVNQVDHVHQALFTILGVKHVEIVLRIVQLAAIMQV